MFLSDKFVARGQVPENLLAHELAHQWFGNRIPINMADLAYNQWLSEGFATYCDALYTEHTDGPKALSTHMQRYGQLFFQFFMMAPRGEGSIARTYPSSGMYRPVVYEKGAVVLHMLRKVMGDEKFFRCLREYVETYQNKASTLDDFRRLASKVHGEDLSWFFGEWIDQTVFAHWKVKAEVTGGEKAGEVCKVKISIEQPNDYVKMPADITLLGAGGEREVVKNVMLDKKEQVVEATAPFKVVKVIVDEDFWVLRHPGSDNIWPAAEKAAAKP
jgi:aminopeptidase N